MGDKQGGGPAFPYPACTSEGFPGQHAHDGMSLRAYLAGQALAGVNLNRLDFGTGVKPLDPWPWVAQKCVRAADAILAELDKETTRGV